MRHITRTRLLTLAFAASSLGLTVAVQDSLNAQTTVPQGIVIDDGDQGYAPGRFAKSPHAPAWAPSARAVANPPTT